MRKIRNPERAAAVRRFALHLCGVVLLVGVLGASIYVSRGYVQKKVAFPDAPPRVVLKNRPAWMTDLLAEEIIRAAQPVGAHSAFDHQLLVDIDHILRTSPWVRDVREIRREFHKAPGDTIEIDCDYRTPLALVRWKDYFWLVDQEGTKLPAQFTVSQLPRIVLGADNLMNLRVIEGVRQPPVESGHKWPGDDLQAGLDLLKLLHGQSWAEEVVKVDVANFGGRADSSASHLTLGTRYDTTIRWGGPINGQPDFLVSTQRKVEHLKQIYSQYGRIDAGQPWIDIRFDLITYPTADAPVARVP